MSHHLLIECQYQVCKKNVEHNRMMTPKDCKWNRLSRHAQTDMQQQVIKDAKL